MEIPIRPNRKVEVIMGIHINNDQTTLSLLTDPIWAQKVDNVVKEGKHYIFWDLDTQYRAVAVVGLGKSCKGYDQMENINLDKEAVRIAAFVGCKALEEVGMTRICIDSFEDAEAAAEGCTLGMWKFQEYNSKPKCPPEINLYSSACDAEDQAWKMGIKKATAQNIARTLTETPSNLLTPTIFAHNVQEMFTGLDVCVEIHDEKWAQGKNMNAFLAVAKGSCQPARFLELTYNKGCRDDAPFVLIGKGVTFDSGGISIKGSVNMDHMRGDMGGAAVCVSTLRALAAVDLQTNIKVLIPLVENMPSGTATKPGDVVKAMNGKTICIDNTDAEGRLILADALSYSACFKPKWVVDIATLTGAIKVALGSSATGVFSNSNGLYCALENAAGKTGDRVWRMPLWKHFTKHITGYTGYDVNNVGKGKGGGSCTAAAFLKEFAPERVNWMHLDIAGVMGPTSRIPYLSKGMTGRPTRALIEFIDYQARVKQTM